jgi:hypothetical protein
MFGHVAQMPQILRGFGFEHAVVWRGVPSAVDASGFWWEAPDGTSVRAEYLPEGYGNGARVPDDAKELLGLVDGFVTTHDDLLTGDVLWMVGTDHLTPRPWLGRVVLEANEVQDDYELVIRSLAEHVAAAPTEGLPHWTGELRSGARANLLMGVTSNRTDVRVAAARAERGLERLAEPLAALFQPAEQWPGRLLDLAWLEVIRNSAHDSICACSHDDVVAAVLHRYAEAGHIADGLVTRAMRHLGRSLAMTGAVVVNPSARTRGGVVELELIGPAEEGDGLQVLHQTPSHRVLHDIAAADAVMVVEREIFYLPALDEVELTIDGADATVVLRTGEQLREVPPSNTTALLADLAEHAQAHPDGNVHVEATGVPRRTVLARVEDVPGYGWAAWDPTAGAAVAPVTGADLSLTNGLVTVVVDPADGSFSMNGHGPLGRIVDDGDAGDTYNWSPPDDDVFVPGPETVTVALDEAGPVRGRLVVDMTMPMPHHIEDDARVGSALVTLQTVLELRAGEDFLRVTTTIDNQARDHRLRVGFWLPEPTDHSEAECAFTVVERGLTAEGGPTERPMATFPSRRFVRAGGLTFAHEGLLEYELADIGDDGLSRLIGITLLRCTGMLSQGPMTMRPLPAGPEDPLEGSQMQGRTTVRYALHLGDRDPYAVVDDAFVPLQIATGEGRGEVADTGQVLSVSGAEVSALLREAGSLVLRLFNPTDAPTTAAVDGRRGWTVDLRGRPLEPFEGTVELGPHGIISLRLDP